MEAIGPGPLPKELDEKRAISEYQDSLSRLKFEQETQRDKTLVLVAGGALTVSFAFIPTFVEHHALTLLWWLFAAWICWTASLAMTVVGYSLSIANYKHVITALSERNWKAVHDQTLIGKLIEPINIATSVAAVTGFVLFGYFAINNLERMSNEKGQISSAPGSFSKKGEKEGSQTNLQGPAAATAGDGKFPASPAARNPAAQTQK
jgi:hypothetical protein